MRHTTNAHIRPHHDLRVSKVRIFRRAMINTAISHIRPGASYDAVIQPNHRAILDMGALAAF